jgi:energy-converting hydrogenase Eha subunit G
MVLQVLQIILFQVYYPIMEVARWVKLVSLINLNFKRLVMEYQTILITVQKVIREVISVAIISLENMLISPNLVQKLEEQLDLLMKRRKKNNRIT